MGMVIRTNITGLNASNALGKASKSQKKGMQKLASGYKINSAADDASGLSISEKMRNQITALDTATDNCEDSVNMLQTAEGYMSEAQDIINRMTELAEKAANGVLDDTDRSALQDEMDELCGEIDRIATTASFNGQKLLDGSLGSKNKVQLISDPDTKTISHSVSDGYTFWEDNNFSFVVDEKALYGVSGKVRIGFNTVFDKAEVTMIPLECDISSFPVPYRLEFQNGATATVANGSNKATFTAVNNHEFELGSLPSTNNTGKDQTYTYRNGAWYDESGNKTNISYTGQCLSQLCVNQFVREAPLNEDGTEKLMGRNGEKGVPLQIGETSTTSDRLYLRIDSFHSDSLFGGLAGFVNTTSDNDNKAASAEVEIYDDNPASTYKKAVSVCIDKKDSASAAADALRHISNYVSDQRGRLGAQQNRLEHTINDLTVTSENTTAAKSRIKDTDMAKEFTDYTSKNVIAQAAQSMLAQANSKPQEVLSLLQNQ